MTVQFPVTNSRDQWTGRGLGSLARCRTSEADDILFCTLPKASLQQLSYDLIGWNTKSVELLAYDPSSGSADQGMRNESVLDCGTSVPVYRVMLPAVKIWSFRTPQVGDVCHAADASSLAAFWPARSPCVREFASYAA